MRSGARGAGRDTRRWRRRIATAKRVRRAVGVRGVAFLVLQRMAPSPHVHPEWFVVLEHETRQAPADVPRPRWGGPDDTRLLLQGERGEEVLRARFARGDRVAIADDGDDLIGYAWYRSGIYDEQGILFELGPGEVWGYDAWIAEDRRGRGNGARLLRGAARALADEGVARVLLGIDHLNLPSLSAARSAGRVPVASVWMVRVAGVSVRREVWAPSRPRWALYRGVRPARIPPRRTRP